MQITELCICRSLKRDSVFIDPFKLKINEYEN